MSNKKRLGIHIVGIYNGAEAAGRAQKDFETRFSRREAPESLPTWSPEKSGELGIKAREERERGLARGGSGGGER